MSWMLDNFRATFSKFGNRTTSEGRKTPRRSQSAGSSIANSEATFVPRMPRRGSTVPMPAQTLRERSFPNPLPPQKCDDIFVGMPAAYQGTYSTVYRGKKPGKSVAIRATRATQISYSTRMELERERAVWFNLDHENVQPLLGVISRPDLSSYDCTVSVWYQNGSLSEYLKFQKVTAHMRVQIILDIARGVRYLHSLNPSIVHGDLKPSNVLIDENKRAVICDFGIAQSVRDELSKNMTNTVSKVNSIRYVAPEMVAGTSSQNPTTYSDVWSLACVIYEIIYSHIPYSHIETKGNASQLALFNEVSNGRQPAKRPSNISRELTQLWKSVLEPSWSSRPNKRPTVASICQYLEEHAAALSASLL